MNKIRMILAVSLIFLASPVFADGLKVPSAALILAQSADVITTHRALASGQGREANPIMAHEPTAIALKSASTAAILLLTAKLGQTHPRIASGVLYTLSGVIGAVSVHNARVGR